MMNKSIIEDDSQYIWHPFTQMKTAPEPIAIRSAKGTMLIAEDGKEYIDGISSWWVNIHGHAHPYIAEKLSKQALQLEHVIFAGFTHQPAVSLGKRLAKYTPDGHQRIFFSDNGSTAVEVGIKMAIQFIYNSGNFSRDSKPVVISLDGAYHGDTFGSMSVSARSTFSAPFDQFLFDRAEVPIPTDDQVDQTIAEIERAIAGAQGAILVYEPLVQGAGGMRMYSAAQLERVLARASELGAVLVADEVMTGFYRTGTFYASDQCDTKPDIIAMSKGLTGGTMALGVTSCHNRIYDAFLSDDHSRTFFHGHSFTANPLACSVSLASLDLLEKRDCLDAVKWIEKQHRAFADKLVLRSDTENVRVQGTIVAFEWNGGEQSGYFHKSRDFIYNFFLERGLLIRPLGNTIYIMPPYCITEKELNALYTGIIDCLAALEKRTAAVAES